MPKVYEVVLNTEQYNDVNGTMLYIANINSIEKGDYILFKTKEQAFMTKVEVIYNYEGLQEGYVLLKLNKIN